MKKWLGLIPVLLMGLCLRAETVEGEMWLMEEKVSFSDTAADDFFALAKEVDLTGNFEDDVWAAGQRTSFSGKAGDDVRLVGVELLTVDGQITGNLRGFAQAGNILLNSNAVVEGRAVLQAGKRITVKGQVQGDLLLEAPRVVIEAEILGDLTLRAGETQLLPGTVIHGDIYDHSRQSLLIPEGVDFRGERKQVQAVDSELYARLQQLRWTLKGLQFLSAFLIGLLMLRLLPRFTGSNVDLILNRRNPALSLGLLSFFLFGFSGYVLLLTVLGTGLGIFLLLVTALLFYLGKIMVAYALGMLLLRRREDLSFARLALALFLGLLVLYSSYSLVYIGQAIYLLSSCWGMGTMLICIRNSQRVLKIELPATSQSTQG